jgi:hypothetical protein
VNWSHTALNPCHIIWYWEKSGYGCGTRESIGKNDTLFVFDPASQKVVRLATKDAEKHTPTQVITATQLKRRAPKGIPVYVMQINNIGIPTMDSGNDNPNDESEPELTSLLTEFSDVFLMIFGPVYHRKDLFNWR